jgi:hypothetical protein
MLVKRHTASYERDASHAALICAVLANINRDPKTKRDPWSPQDFMPTQKAAKPKRAQTWQDQQMIAKLLNQAFGGRVADVNTSS